MLLNDSLLAEERSLAVCEIIRGSPPVRNLINLSVAVFFP